MGYEKNRFKAKDAKALLDKGQSYALNPQWIQVELAAIQKQMGWKPVEDDYKEEHYAAFEGYIYPGHPVALFNKSELEKDAGITTGVSTVTETGSAELLKDTKGMKK